MREEVYYNIFESPYYLEISDFKFYFSSNFNKRRFLNQYHNFTNLEREKLEGRYQMKIDSDIFFLMILYRKIEKRGFRVMLDDMLINKDLSFEFSMVI